MCFNGVLKVCLPLQTSGAALGAGGWEEALAEAVLTNRFPRVPTDRFDGRFKEPLSAEFTCVTSVSQGSRTLLKPKTTANRQPEKRPTITGIALRGVGLKVSPFLQTSGAALGAGEWEEALTEAAMLAAPVPK
jgi:hypothetical protein